MLALRDPIGFKKAVLEAKTARTLRMNTAAYTASNVASAAAAPAPVAAPTPVTPAPAPSGEDVTRTLTALAGLRDSGAITPEEYEAKKKELLDRI
jgi:hypothetical protein